MKSRFKNGLTWLCSKPRQLTKNLAHAYSFSVATLTHLEQSRLQQKCIKANTWRHSHRLRTTNDDTISVMCEKTYWLRRLSLSISILSLVELPEASHTKWSDSELQPILRNPHVLLSRKMFQ